MNRKKTTTSPNRPPVGPKTLTGTAQAKRQTAVILEVLSGLRGPSEGSEAMGVSLNRYYQLETRALQGMILALEPRPKGRQRSPEDEIGALKDDKERLERELARSQALVRAAQRSMGIPAPPRENRRRMKGKAGKSEKPVRRRRRVVRATKAIAVLRQSVDTTPPGEPTLEAKPASPAAS